MNLAKACPSLCLFLAAASTAVAQLANPPVTPREQIAQVLDSLAPAGAGAAAAPMAAPANSPLVSLNDSGLVRHLGAPPGTVFPAGVARVPGRPDLTGRNFLKQHAAMMGVSSPAVDFTALRTRQRRGRHYVRLEQTYQGIPVFAAQANLQLDAGLDIESILADLPPSTVALDNGLVPLTASLSEAQAGERVRTHFAALAEGERLALGPARLTVFVPEVLDEAGPTRLVWELEAGCEDGTHVSHRVLVDARSGEIVRAWNLSCTALDRDVWDFNNNTNSTAVSVRSEGQPATGIAAVDLAYTFSADVYNFYLTQHQRDSYDDEGAQIKATVRWCSAACGCPCVNAFSGNASSPSTGMVFGNGFVTDDIVAHEFTHRVTQLESGLIYTNASGAINESFSDVWGEFTDLLYSSSGDDSAGVRWEIGEDRTSLPNGGTIREMDDPPNRNDPDRLNSPLYQPPSNTNDNGGVHSNSGVNNKLAYLLTDGDTFNGQTIYGLGIGRIADLYYEVQVGLLLPAAGWADLANALRQAAVNLGWNIDDQNNLYRACLAVEIAAPTDRYVDWTIICPNPNGNQICNLLVGSPFWNVTQGVTESVVGDRLFIRGGSYPETVTFKKITTVRAFSGSAVIGTPSRN